jgi:pimeloyl-ACP methyl ester carboxylesterase
MPQVEVNALTINYEVQGEGEPLLLIPYLSADHACYAFQLPAYTEHFSCIAIDLPGSGESDKPAGPYSTDGYADQVAAFLGAIGIERAHVAGVSLGAAVGIHLAARHPGRVRSLSLHSGWHASDDYLKVVVEQWRTLASALPTVADVVIQAIFPWCFTPEMYVERPEFVDGILGVARRIVDLAVPFGGADRMPTNAYPITDGGTHRDLFGGVPPNPDAQRPPTPDRGRLRMSLRSAGKRPPWRDEFPASSLLLHWPGCWPAVTTPATGAAPPGTTSRGVRLQGPRCHFPDPTSARRVSSSARTTAETDRGRCLRSTPNRRGCHGSHVPARNSWRQPRQAVGADGPATVAGGRRDWHPGQPARDPPRRPGEGRLCHVALRAPVRGGRRGSARLDEFEDRR